VFSYSFSISEVILIRNRAFGKKQIVKFVFKLAKRWISSLNLRRMSNLTTPLVGILMGSDSDWPTMKLSADALAEFGVSCEAKVISAHRDPRGLEDYAGNAVRRGLKVIIAGAGGAAHLPGVTAAFTTLPVIGVPIESKSLKGLDSLLSIVQMPPGVPVATVGIGAARNAGLLAVQILAVGDTKLEAALEPFKIKLAEESRAKNKNLKM
jgi:5-(carboxyamino)imidazole ribonucleotide mutase